ncbi:MAG: hypothetical protein RL095_2053 [Verrucomicrobiota bacterium]|jgi:hypothetical protein
MRFLCVVEEVFEISGRGCVLVPGLDEKSDQGILLYAKDPIELRLPDGCIIRTYLNSIEFLDGPNKRVCIPICLPLGFRKSDIPIGTEVWLLDSQPPGKFSPESD